MPGTIGTAQGAALHTASTSAGMLMALGGSACVASRVQSGPSVRSEVGTRCLRAPHRGASLSTRRLRRMRSPGWNPTEHGAEMIACPDCGLLAEVPPLPPGANALCRLCGAALERTNGRSITAALGCALGTFILLFPSHLSLLLSVSMFGLHTQTRLGSGVAMLWDHGWVVLAGLTGACAVVLPFIRFGLLSVVLGAVRLGSRPAWLGPGFRWALWLDVWAMPDVFLLGCCLGYYRLLHVKQMTMTIEAGGYCFLAAALLALVARAALDRRAVWRAIGPDAALPEDGETLSCTACDLVQALACEGRDCPRCGARLHTRKPHALQRATAFTAAAFVLFFPAAILPMDTTVSLGHHTARTLFTGVRAVFHAGLWPVGVLIFCASIGIPALKIIGMGWLLLSIRRRSPQHLVATTQFYRFINAIGRWANIDPFALAVFVPLMTFKSVASSDAAWGATAFITVVVLTLLASMSFDPRLMWDAAARRTP